MALPPSNYHAEQTVLDGIHIPYAFFYPSHEIRIQASGFSLTDVGKLARVQEDESLWMLLTNDPASWGRVSFDPTHTHPQVELIEGVNIRLDRDLGTNTITINNTALGFTTIMVEGQNDVIANETGVLTFWAGDHTQITSDPINSSVTIGSDGTVPAHGSTHLADGGDPIPGLLTMEDLEERLEGISGVGFGTVTVAGQQNVVAALEANSIAFAAGTGMQITTNPTTKTVTFNCTVTGGGGGGGGSTMPLPHGYTHVASDMIPNAMANGSSGLMSGSDKAKLDGITSGAERNVINSISGSGSITVQPAGGDRSYVIGSTMQQSSVADSPPGIETSYGIVNTSLSSGGNFYLKRLQQGSGVILSDTGNAISISATGSGEVNIPLASGSPLRDGLMSGTYASKLDGVQAGAQRNPQFVGNGITIVDTFATDGKVTFTAGAGGETVTASNLEPDATNNVGVFKTKIGSNLNFRSIMGGDGITVSKNGVDTAIRIDSNALSLLNAHKVADDHAHYVHASLQRSITARHYVVNGFDFSTPTVTDYNSMGSPQPLSISFGEGSNPSAALGIYSMSETPGNIISGGERTQRFGLYVQHRGNAAAILSLPEKSCTTGLEVKTYDNDRFGTNTMLGAFVQQKIGNIADIIGIAQAGSGACIRATTSNANATEPGIRLSYRGRGDGIISIKEGGDSWAVHAIAKTPNVTDIWSGCILAESWPSMTSDKHATLWSKQAGGGHNLLVQSSAPNAQPAAEILHWGPANEVFYVGHFGNAPNSWAGHIHSDTGNGLVVAVPAGKIGLSVVGGTKPAIVETSQGQTAMYAEEATEVWFCDYGFASLVKGKATVALDPLFLETIERDEPYHVFVQEYGDCGALKVLSRGKTSFVVAEQGGLSNATFSYRVVGKRKHYKGKRMECVTELVSQKSKAPVP